MTPKGSLFKNFGPKIGCYQLSEDHLKSLQDYAQAIFDNPEEQIDWGKNLAGQIHNEPYLIENDEIYGILNVYTRHYLRSLLTDWAYDLQQMKITSSIKSAWLVDQRPGEYNPTHFHTGTNVSSVLYLDMPEFEYDQALIDKGKNQPDGQISFINSSMRTLAELEMGQVSWTPTIGSVYVFPSRLLHAVNPWKGKGRRLSLSWNTGFIFDPPDGVRLKPINTNTLSTKEKQHIKNQSNIIDQIKTANDIVNDPNRKSS